nr:GxxExxY protein [Desulfobulbaceae bacterium]
MGDVYLKEICYKINGAVFEVFRELVAGFLEKVYEKALLLELQSRGIVAKKKDFKCVFQNYYFLQ